MLLRSSLLFAHGRVHIAHSTDRHTPTYTQRQSQPATESTQCNPFTYLLQSIRTGDTERNVWQRLHWTAIQRHWATGQRIIVVHPSASCPFVRLIQHAVGHHSKVSLFPGFGGRPESVRWFSSSRAMTWRWSQILQANYFPSNVSRPLNIVLATDLNPVLLLRPPVIVLPDKSLQSWLRLLVDLHESGVPLKTSVVIFYYHVTFIPSYILGTLQHYHCMEFSVFAINDLFLVYLRLLYIRVGS